jgi:hypothetical protein
VGARRLNVDDFNDFLDRAGQGWLKSHPSMMALFSTASADAGVSFDAYRGWVDSVALVLRRNREHAAQTVYGEVLRSQRDGATTLMQRWKARVSTLAKQFHSTHEAADGPRCVSSTVATRCSRIKQSTLNCDVCGSVSVSGPWRQRLETLASVVLRRKTKQREEQQLPVLLPCMKNASHTSNRVLCARMPVNRHAGTIEGEGRARGGEAGAVDQQHELRVDRPSSGGRRRCCRRHGTTVVAAPRCSVQA